MFRCPRYPGIPRAGPDNSKATSLASPKRTDTRRPPTGRCASKTSAGNATKAGAACVADRTDRDFMVITNDTLQQRTDTAA